MLQEILLVALYWTLCHTLLDSQGMWKWVEMRLHYCWWIFRITRIFHAWKCFLSILWPIYPFPLYAKMTLPLTPCCIFEMRHFLDVLTLFSWTLNKVWQELPGTWLCVYMYFIGILIKQILQFPVATPHYHYNLMWVITMFHWFQDIFHTLTSLISRYLI